MIDYEEAVRKAARAIDQVLRLAEKTKSEDAVDKGFGYLSEKLRAAHQQARMTANLKRLDDFSLDQYQVTTLPPLPITGSSMRPMERLAKSSPDHGKNAAAFTPKDDSDIDFIDED